MYHKIFQPLNIFESNKLKVSISSNSVFYLTLVDKQPRFTIDFPYPHRSDMSDCQMTMISDQWESDLLDQPWNFPRHHKRLKLLSASANVARMYTWNLNINVTVLDGTGLVHQCSPSLPQTTRGVQNTNVLTLYQPYSTSQFTHCECSNTLSDGL